MIDYAAQIPALAKVRQNFLTVLVDRERILVAALDNLMLERTRTEALAEIESVTHKIAGTGGALGFPELGIMARDVEEAVMSSRQTGQPRLDILAGMVSTFISEVRATLR